jgi:hypothetical protein
MKQVSILKKMKSLHLWAFEKHLISQNAHMGWMHFSNLSTQLIIGEFAGSTPVVGCMGKNESNFGVSKAKLIRNN